MTIQEAIKSQEWIKRRDWDEWIHWHPSAEYFRTDIGLAQSVIIHLKVIDILADDWEVKP